MSKTRVPALHDLRAFALAIAAASSIAAAVPAFAAPTLEGWALMPANTVATGPTTGQFGGNGFGANSSLLPISNAQSVQGLSGVLRGPKRGTYYVMPDNGFGAKGNSADALLRVYAVRPDFRRWRGNAVVGSGVVNPVNFRNGDKLNAFGPSSFIGLRDPDFNLGFKIQADFERYYDNASNPLVDPSIRAQRLLTGADFDIESVRRDRRGNLWFGDEFGPFLLETDPTGRVLRSELQLPNIKPFGSTAAGAFVQSPQNPFLNGLPNLGGSRGFEGMAINPAGTKLYTLL